MTIFKRAIIILGGNSDMRQSAALELFFRIKANEIFLVGDQSFYFENCNAKIVNNIQNYNGLKIFNTNFTSSQNTYQDIKTVKKIIRDTDYSYFYIITSDYHFKRVKIITNFLLNKEEINKIIFKIVRTKHGILKIIKEFISLCWYKLIYGL